VNIVSLGALVSCSRVCDPDALVDKISSSVPQRFIDMNVDAYQRGLTLGLDEKAV
jgi:Pyruvate/2-oxoacid:ferredoxin oxidoreductase gamma subunit